MPAPATSRRLPPPRLISPPPAATVRHAIDAVWVQGADAALREAFAAALPDGVAMDRDQKASTAAAASTLTVVVEGTDGTLPPEGYRLRVLTSLPGPLAVVVGADRRGLRHGLLALGDLLRGDPPSVPVTEIHDWPELAWRGTIEGFYGPPWTHQDRLDHLAFAGRHRLNHYVYAPKDDPYHRERWRDPYPPAELDLLAGLAAAAERHQVRFVYALSPGLSMRYSDDAEHAALLAKAQQLRSAGVHGFALLFDDIPTELTHPEDVAAFGAGPQGAGAAHGRACALFARAMGLGGDLVMVPTDYAGGQGSPYRRGLTGELPADVLVWWTGRDIVVGEVTREDVDDAAAAYGRELLLWDNMPVNDFDRSRLFLGPLVGRTGDVRGSALRGISANPMIEAAASQLTLATVAEWAWDPQAYDPEAAAGRALRAVCGEHAECLAPLVEACSAWPPSAPQSPQLAALAEAALTADAGSTAELAERLRALAAVPAGLGKVAGTMRTQPSPPTTARLLAQLRPWADAGAAMAEAGLAAVAALDGTADADPAVLSSVESALDRAEQHYPNVLRGVVPPFVRAVLDRMRGAEGSASPSGRAPRPARVALVLDGTEPDSAVTTALERHGIHVLTAPGRDLPEVLADERPVLVVVTPRATPDEVAAVADLPVPVAAWGHPVGLGLATSSDVLTVQDTLDLVHPVAGLAAGPLVVHRGPGTVRWSAVAEHADVIARTTDGRPAVAHYRAGCPLADGRSAPAGRTLLFLGAAGPAPWLLTEAGAALVDHAIGLTLATR